MTDFIAEATALLVMSPLAWLTYRAAFLARLTEAERRSISEARKTERFKAQRNIALAGALALVIGTSGSTKSAPLWVWLLVWTVNWTLLALAYAHWSLSLRRRDYVLWLESVVSHRRVEVGSFLLHFFVALIPGVILFGLFAPGGLQ